MTSDPLARFKSTKPHSASPDVEKKRKDPHFGCLLEWAKKVLPLVKSKDQLAVAIWLHRRRALRKSDVFDVPNEALRLDLSVGRQVKYRTLQRLEQADVVTIIRNGKQAIKVRIL
jgi:hypothetical protein